MVVPATDVVVLDEDILTAINVNSVPIRRPAPWRLVVRRQNIHVVDVHVLAVDRVEGPKAGVEQRHAGHLDAIDRLEFQQVWAPDVPVAAVPVRIPPVPTCGVDGALACDGDVAATNREDKGHPPGWPVRIIIMADGGQDPDLWEGSAAGCRRRAVTD
jgi:hypothetical protein